MSSPSERKINSIIKGTKKSLVRAGLLDLENKQYVLQIEEQKKRKLVTRKNIQTGGAMSVTEAREKIRVKE
jgi:hypothetical protein